LLYLITQKSTHQQLQHHTVLQRGINISGELVHPSSTRTPQFEKSVFIIEDHTHCVKGKYKDWTIRPFNLFNQLII